MAALWPGRIIQKLPPACGDPLRNVSILERLKKSATLLDPTKLVPCFPGDGVRHHFAVVAPGGGVVHAIEARLVSRSEEHTSELQSRENLASRALLDT